MVYSLTVDDNVRNIKVYADYICSDHRPLSLTFACSVPSNNSNNNYEISTSVLNSYQLHKDDTCMLQAYLEEKLLNISYPACDCKSVSCNNSDHLKRIEDYFDNIMSILRDATDTC